MGLKILVIIFFNSKTQKSTINRYSNYLYSMINLSNITLLLADDDDDDRVFFSDVLAEIAIGYSLIITSNGSLLMNMLMLDNVRPHLIFLDLNMPCKNGMECLAEIKQEKILENLPVVIISTSLDKYTVDYVYDHGAKRYLVKPNSFSKMKEMIKQVLILFLNGKLSSLSKDKFIMQQ